MNTIPENKIEELVREKLDGKSYSLIRKELIASGMMEEDIGRLIRLVDEKVLNETTLAGGRKKVQQWYRLGQVLAIAGLLLTIAFNTGTVLAKLPSLIVYAPFFAGILVMIYGKAIQRKDPGPLEKSPGAIRKRRPYK
jgi:hypothetical protein